MRIEQAGPRTWLLAVLAGWALCVWLLAMAGLGGGIDRLDEHAAAQRSLPVLRPLAPERLGPLAGYDQSGLRPLFTEDRRPQPFVVDPMAGADAPGAFDVVLTGVLRTPAVRMVLVQPREGGRSIGVREGASPEGFPDWSLHAVESRAAVFDGPDGRIRLELRQFDGSGGQAPTPMSMADGMEEMADRGAGNADSGEMAAMEHRGPESSPAASQMPAVGGAAGPDGAVSATQAGAGSTSEADARRAREQVDAIRKRIEQRRARQREQAGQTPRQDQTP